MDRRSRTGEIVDRVHLDIKREGDVVAHVVKALVPQKVLDIAPLAREQIVNTQNIMAVGDEPVTQV